ncbi:cilia- and flagella-associated protein 65 isoform X3 [Narcine bancroftii]|uniref:cilia- and flagella-associated protein 65 isoform X3 n=1 Tax=Narcine bancroftii TaxID=1343680 RepID=UPI003831EE6D
MATGCWSWAWKVQSDGNKWNVHNVAKTKISGRKRTKAVKSNFYGIEVLEYLEWLDWDLGIESTKHIILKNVQFKTQKLKYSPPSTAFFTTLFPQPVVLSPGTSYSLPVTFCAVEKQDYEDRIVFETKGGKFSVVLQASLPSHDVQLPDLACLPICAIFESTETTFHLRNNSKLLTPFHWEVQNPFFLIPNTGILKPWGDCKIKIVFQPHTPKVFDIIAICKFGENEHEKFLKLQGIAKFPHLLMSVPGQRNEMSGQEDVQSSLHFGHVAVGCIAEKHLEIHNYSIVNTSFSVVHLQQAAMVQSEFTCEVREGMILACSKLQIPFKFMPQTVGALSVNYFHIKQPGNISRSLLKVTGSCKGPVVSLSDLKLNFGCVFLGDVQTYSVEISNLTDVPTFYQFEIDCSQSVFVIDRPCGFLGGESTQMMKVTFRPTHPMNYYRRVACLIHHQDPLFLDLIGTCHSDQLMPAILTPKHLEQYRTNMMRGLTFYPPDILTIMQQEGKLQLDADGALMLVAEKCCQSIGLGGNEDCLEAPASFPNIPTINEYFDDGVQSSLTMFPPHVSTSKREFDFGNCLERDRVVPLPFSMMNHTKGKITVLWVTQPGSVFTVMPQTIDIPPLKSMAFRIHFSPNKLNMLYAAELECFTYYKVMRDHRLVKGAIQCPPWFLTVHVQASTFQPGHEHFIPNFALDSPKVMLPAMYEKGTAYRTLLLKNTGDTPLTFSLRSPHETIIRIKPNIGFILPKAHQILTLKVSPQNEGLTKYTLPLHLNASEKYNQELRLFCTVEKPLVSLDGNGYLYFKPTCIGTLSKRSYFITNMTRMPLYFQWKTSAAGFKVLSVKPNFGIIQANESLAQLWSFSPQEQQKYFLKPHIYVWGVKGPHCTEQGKKIHFTLRVIGEGTVGRITVEKEHIHLGDILVGNTQSGDLVLLNNESCSLNFSLNVKQDITGPCDPDAVVNDPMAFELENHHGTIPARSRLYFRFVARPVRRLHYTWTIRSKILSAKALGADTDEEEKPLCSVTADGVYPMIFISDARCLGSISGISKQQLWRLFSLNILNEYLQRDPTEGELLYQVPTRHSTSRCPPVSTPVMVDFNFGAAPVCSDPAIVLLMLENREILPVDWAFLFPMEQQLDLEYWAETGEFNPTELHEMRIEDNHLFTMEPKSGCLFPGQRETIQLTYRHELSGTDRIPVLLKLSHGREILLNFIGITMPKDHCYVHFLATQHRFAPVCIDTYHPPKQVYELYNGGSGRVIYDIQLDSVKSIQEENYNHPIFRCLNPRGEIRSGMTAYIEWIFSPLEAKSYSVDVPIHILNGDSALVTFTGIGYDKRILGTCASFNDPSSFFGAPGVQRAPVIGQLMFMSEERISFGNIPVFTKSSRFIFLYNVSETEVITYSWHSMSAHVSEASSIAPISGVLQPGGSTHCIVTLRACKTPCFYDLDLICEVYSKQQVTQYQKELQEWEREKDRQQVEFTITEQSLQENQSVTLQRQCCRDSQGTCSRKKRKDTDTKIMKYKTLPPIKELTETWVGRKVEKLSPGLWEKPKPPKAFLLHLGVIARAHSMEEYHKNFPSDVSKHYIMRNLISEPLPAVSQAGSRGRPWGKWTNTTADSLSSASKEDMRLVIDVLTTVLRCLLEDVSFQNVLVAQTAEPIPYFAQFWSEEGEELAMKSGKRAGAKASSAGTGSEQVQDSTHLMGKEETLSSTAPRNPDVKPITSLDSIQMDEKWLTAGGQEVLNTIRIEEQLARRQRLKRLPEFCDLLEQILENTLQNIVIEASRGEVVLTARPRVIALPPMISRNSIEPFSMQELSISKEEVDQDVSNIQDVEISAHQISESKIEPDHATPKVSSVPEIKRPGSLAALKLVSASHGGIPSKSWLNLSRFSKGQASLYLSALSNCTI